MTPEELILEAESRGIKGGRSVDLKTATWAIVVAAEGGLRKIDPEEWHDCVVCGLNHRRDDPNSVEPLF